MSNNNYFIDGKIKLPYNFEKEKYIIGIEKKSNNTLVGSKTILPIKDALPNNKIEITPIFSPIFYFKNEENKFNVVENELKYNINLFIDETPVSMFELNDEDGLVVDWSDKYFIEKTGPRSFKLCLNDNYTSITDTNSVQYTELVNNGVFSESINIYIKYNDLYFNTKIDVLFSKSYFETTSLYDTIDVNSGVSENAISIEGYYNGTKVSKDNLSLKLKEENNSFTAIISTLGYASLKQNKNEWILYCENSDKNPTEKKYTVDGNGNITTLNGTIVKYVQDDITGEFFDLSNGTKIFLKVENIDDTIVYYNSDKTVIPGINIFDPFNNIKINEVTSYDSVNSVIKDTHDRVSEQKDGKYYPLDKIFKTTILNGGDKILYDKNGRLISTTSGSTLLLENGLILDGTNILSGSTVVISGNAILNNLNGTITKKNNNAFYYRGKLLYSGGTGYFNEEPVSNICPLITDDNGNVLYNVKKSANKIEIIGEKENYSLTFSNNKWIVNGPNRTFTANNIGELIYINVVIGDTNGNLYRRHDLNIHDFKNTHNILDGLTIKEICGDEKEYKPITREEVYFDAHSINDIKKSIPNLYTYLNLYKGGNLPKINIITTCNGVLKDEKVFYLSNNKLNHSSYNIKIEPQVITQSMITNGSTVTAYVVNKSGEFIPFDTYSNNNYSLSYICDGSGTETGVISDVCTINLTKTTPVYNDIKFILKCNDNIVKQEIIEVLGENKFITSVKYIDVTTGANYTIAPTEDFYGNKINWTTGNTSASTILTQLKISAGDTVQKTLNGYVNGVKVHEQIVIPVKNGNDGESPYTLVLTNTNASINCDSEGNILNGINMPTCKAILYKGTTEVTNVKYSINSVTGVRIETDGVLIFDTGFTFTGDSLEIVVSATTNSVLRGTAIMTITKTKQGPKGDTGTSGKGISSVIEYYLATSANTDITTATSGWKTGIDKITPIKKYLWNYEKTTYTDSSTGATNPVIIGTYGDTGKGIINVTEYYQISTANTVTSLTNNWSTGITETDSINKYLWNYEKTTYTDGSTGATNPVIIGTHGEKGDTGEKGESAVSYWMDITPNVIKKNGINFSDTLIKISKWKQEGAYEPILMTGETVFVYHERREDPFTATTGTTYTIPTGFNRNTLTFKWADGTGATDTVYDVQTIPIIKDGENGGKGDRGKLLYPAGRWDSGTIYNGTDSEKTPFVVYNVNGVDKYYVLTATTIISGETFSPINRGWTEMAQYEALYTKLLVAENGLVGGSVYNGDYVFSKSGISSGDSTNNYSGFTNSIVESVFTGDTPNNNFIPNYLVDFNKGRAWFGGGNTIINEKGIIYSKDIVDITHELPIPYPSGTTQNGWDRITTGITVENYISGGTKVYIKNIKNLNVFVYDDYESEVKTCPRGFIFLDVILPEDLFPIQNTWYNGSIIFSNTCPHTKLIRFPYSNVRDNLTTYKPYVQLYSYNCPFGLNVGEDGCLKYMYHPAKKIVEIIGSNHKVYETIKEKYEYDWPPSN